MRSLRLLAVFLRNSLQVEMEYRANLVAAAANSVLTAALSLAALLAVFGQTDTVGGWTLAQMLALLGVVMVLEGLIDSWLHPSLNQVSEYVRTGDLDLLLIRPVNSQFIVSFRHLRIWYGPNILLGLGAVGWSMALQGTLTAGNVLLFLLLLAAAVAIFYAIWLATSTLAFWFTKLGEVWIIAFTMMEIGRFPTGAYPAWLRFAITFVVPIAFMTTVPAEAAAGLLTWERALVAVAVAAASLAAASALWRLALSRYSGASS